MVSQELLSYVANETKKGGDYYSIHKSLMKSDHKVKDIDEALRLVNIAGANNIDGNFLEKMNSDPLYLKVSGASSWFNIILGLLLVELLFTVVIIPFIAESGETISATALLLHAIIVSVLAYGIYYAYQWAIGACFIGLIFTFTRNIFDLIVTNLTMGI